jgi:hypothetical protein
MLLPIMEAPAPHVASIGLRALFAAFGSLFLYMALFMFRDEQGRLQNRLVTLWVKVKQAEDEFAAFVRQTAILTDHAANWMFGDKIFSLKAMLMSSYLAVASAYLGLSFVEGVKFVMFAAFFSAISLIWLRRLEGTRPYIAALALSVVLYLAFQQPWREEGSGVLLRLPLVGIICDFLVIGINRAVIRKLIQSLRGTIILFTLLYDAFWVSLFVLLFLSRLKGTYVNRVAVTFVRKYALGEQHGVAEWAVDWLLTLNLASSFTAIVCAGLFLVALAAVFHKLVWPLLDRTITAIAEFNLLGDRKIQAGLGTAFLLLSFPSLGEWLKLFHLT